MIVKRTFYAVLLSAAIAAFILTGSGVALFICVCLVAVPVISFTLLVVASKNLQFDFTVRSSCIRGGVLQIVMKAGLKPRFFAGYVKVIAVIENSTFQKTVRKAIIFKDLSYNPHVYEYVGTDAGRIRVQFAKIKIIDLFGICSYGVNCSRFAESFVSPMLYDDLRLRLGSSTKSQIYGETVLPQKGSDHTEIFNIRDYTAGDSLNSVHWKLSSKFDILKSKEYGSSDDRNTAILVDLSRRKTITDKQLNAVLDAAISISNSLCEGGYSHSVCWFTDGKLFRAEVTDNSSFVIMVNALMSIKVHYGNAQSLFYFFDSPECSAFTKILYISASLDAEDFSNLGKNVTAILLGNTFGEMDESGYRVLNIPTDKIATALFGTAL